MPYKTFTANTEALASEVMQYLMQQAIATFATSAARSTAIPVPVVGQVTHCNDRMGRLQYWNGSAWTDILSANPYMVSGNTSYLTNAYGAVTVTFPGTPAFYGVPVVVAMDATSWGSAASTVGAGIVWSLVSVSSTNFVAKAMSVNEIAVANTNVRLQWHLFGVIL